MSGETIVVRPVIPQLTVQPTVMQVGVTGDGPQGPQGAGVPMYGDQYQLLQKKTSTNLDTEWTSVLRAIDKIAMDTAAGQTAGVGEIVWNDTDGTLDVGLKGGHVTLQVGQEIVSLVKSDTNSGLADGSVVYLTGSDGSNVTVLPAKANTESTSSRTFGVMTESATGGNKGFCTSFGMVHGLNTAALTEGAIIWLSPVTAGGMTTTKPVAPDHLVTIGVCVRSHATQGVVFVNVSNGYELDELHNVSISNPIDDQVLTWNGSLWVNMYPPISQAFSQQGILAPTTGASRFYIERDGVLAHIRAGVGTAPVGSPLEVRVNVSNTGSVLLTIPVNENTAAATPDLPIHLDDYVTVDIVSVGSNTAGSDLVVTVTIE